MRRLLKKGETRYYLDIDWSVKAPNASEIIIEGAYLTKVDAEATAILLRSAGAKVEVKSEIMPADEMPHIQ